MMEAFGLGSSLQRLRTRAGYSVSDLARRSGVGKATLSRWENGQAQPTVGALTPVLDVLGVLPEDRQALFAAISAPRGLRAIRDLERVSKGSSMGPVPAGSLIRALRLRQRLQVRQVAARLGVTPSTLSRWELGERMPDLDSLHRLCELLGASEEERAAVMTQRPILGSSQPTIESVSAGIDRLWHHLRALELNMVDLRFEVLTAEASILARQTEAGGSQLARVLDLRTFHLCESGRLREARRLALESVSLPDPGDGRNAGSGAMVQLAWIDFSLSKGRDWSRSLRILTEEAEATSSADIQIECGLQSMRFLALGGFAGQLVAHAERVLKLMIARGHPYPEAVVNWFLGEAYVHAGCFDKALRILPDPTGSYTHPLHFATARAEAYLRMGDRDAAEPYLAQMRSIMERHGFANFDEQRVLALAEKM